MAGIVVAIEEKRFPGASAHQSKLVLQDVSFRMRAGEFVAIVGPSGCGKTTLLNIVAGLDRDFVGRIDLGFGPAAPRIGYVFQNARLLPWRTVRDNIALVLPKHGDSRAVDAMLREVGLFEARDVFASRLSVGMSRRAAIARALVIEPDLLLMDEPFVSLDEAMAERLRQMLLDVLRAHPTSVLFVTHDVREAALLADRVLLLSPAPGRLIADVPI
ncbi:MAG TPA: ATP-binding cassette domain-containing protein, partial [Alphaproteobacteria bacterium]|nr:ATP-binding cassette domain-containing protein [Alphaproteobacteria bacterium]